MSFLSARQSRSPHALAAALVAAALLVSAPPRSSSAAPREPEIDRQEQLFGATRVNAALGHGRLTAAISRFGELTVLRWPNPSFYEHVNIATAGGKGARDLPWFGAKANEGSFAALVLARSGKVTVSWLRDETTWTHEQVYVSDRADTLRTRYRSDALGVTVESTDVIDPRRDVLARRYQVAPDAYAEYDAIALVYYENFAPQVEKEPFVPVGQHSLDHKRDYALVYDAARDALIHGSVIRRPAEPLSKLSAGADAAAVKAFLAAIAGKKGAFLAVGGSRAAAGFQCGVDAVDGAKDPPGGGGRDAYDDVSDDGALSGSRAAVRHATGALRFDLAPRGGDVTVFIALGETAAAAGAALDEARKLGFGDIARASEKVWADWLFDARLPDTRDADRLRIARRALMTIRTATDPKSGAVVASVATQPPYAEDWPRDGAFINYALDVAGKHAVVTRHNQSYAAWQRKKDGEQVFGGGKSKGPAGSFAMNYYPDGVPSGFIPFEIDHVGLVLWTWYRHATFLADEASRRQYLESIWSALVLAADLLTRCKDEATKLQCAANEDDDPELTISLHGAVPTLLGLRSAVRAARYLGKTADAERWLARVRELEVAFEATLYVPGGGYNGIAPGQRSEFWPLWRRTGAVAWALWPGVVGPHDSKQMRETADELFRQLSPFFDKRNSGGAYHAKGTIALAMHYAAIGDKLGVERTRTWLDVLVKEVAAPGTGHFGEAYIYADHHGDGRSTFANRVAIPHVWEASLVYLSLMAAYSPSTLVPRHLAALEPDSDGSSGCGVAGAAHDRRDASRPPPVVPLALVLALALLVSRVSRRHRRRAGRK